MSDVNSLEELIEWLKSENFDRPTTFEKFKEDEYDANIFCMASDADLNDLDPTLKGGPKILLRNLRDKLKDAKNGQAPQPIAGTKSQATPPPAPKPQTNTVPPSDERSGKETPEYKAVINVYGNITRALQMTPSANTALSIKFIQENWIEPGVKCSNDNLLESALAQILQKASQFQVFLSMLRDMAGMDLVVKQLQGKVIPPGVQSVTPVVAVGGTPSATVPLPSMNHPIFDFTQFGKPNQRDLMNCVGHKVTAKWRPIGEGLGLGGNDLNTIQIDSAGKPNLAQHALGEVFQLWYSAETSEYSWQNLANVLESPAVKEKLAVRVLHNILSQQHKQ